MNITITPGTDPVVARAERVRDITFLSFRLEGRDPYAVPQDEWSARARNVRRSLIEHPESWRRTSRHARLYRCTFETWPEP